METYILKDFDIQQIHRSGQCFRMEQTGEDIFRVLAKDRYLEIAQTGEECCFFCTEEEFESFWKQYFDLDRDYGEVKRSIDSRDIYLREAAQKGWGIRILKQDMWEMIVSFLISQQNNIPRIRKCIQNICEKYGEKRISDNGIIYYTFPTPSALSGAAEEDLRACNLGYRSRYVLETAKRVADGEVDLKEIEDMDYPDAKQELLKLYGVGEKVADCICLFALHHLEAFPVDTHIRQALDKHYPKGFPHKRYMGNQGILQQYIFYYELFFR